MQSLFISRPLPQKVIKAAQGRFDVELRSSTDPLSPEEMRHCLSAFDYVIATLGDNYSSEIFASVTQPKTQLIANFGVGFNHIDVAAAQAAGVEVSNTPGAVTDATADIAMTLMLMSARRAGEGERLVRSGAWSGWHPTQMLGLHLSGKHVGIVGMGRIGQAIARRCHFGFGMQVSYFNRSAKEVAFPARQIASLQDLAAQVDVLVIAVPGGDTRHLIDAQILQAMQPHAHVINIARGEVIDEAALIEALREGKIAGAGLDVYEFEPSVPQALIETEQAVVLPHLGTAALEVREDMGLMALDNVIAVSERRAAPNSVSP